MFDSFRSHIVICQCFVIFFIFFTFSQPFVHRDKEQHNMDFSDIFLNGGDIAHKKVDFFDIIEAKVANQAQSNDRAPYQRSFSNLPRHCANK